MSKEKQCSKCLAFKPLTEFYRDRTNLDGLKSHCKQCIDERMRKYSKANKEKVAESKRKYYEANKEKITEHQRKYKQANKEKVYEYMRKYYEANKEEITESKRKFRDDQRKHRVLCDLMNANDPETLRRITAKLEQLNK